MSLNAGADQRKLNVIIGRDDRSGGFHRQNRDRMGLNAKRACRGGRACNFQEIPSIEHETIFSGEINVAEKICLFREFVSECLLKMTRKETKV